jgi:hypothetical protein
MITDAQAKHSPSRVASYLITLERSFERSAYIWCKNYDTWYLATVLTYMPFFMSGQLRAPSEFVVVYITMMWFFPGIRALCRILELR